MADVVEQLTSFFHAISVQLGSLTTAVNSQSVVNIVPTFAGNPAHFKNWIKAIQRYEILTGVDDEKLKGITLQSAQGPVADFIARWMRDHQNQTWAHLKTELQSRFGEITDRSIAFSMLRRVRQERNESVQIYAERLLAIAEDAFTGQDQADLPTIERQLVGFFIDGLAYDYLKLKVMRENPDRLQAAVHIAMTEQNLRRKFNLRTGREDRTVEPMEVDHARPARCQLCKRNGHEARECRTFRRERAEAVNMTRQFSGSRGRDQRQIPRQSSSLICWFCYEPGHKKVDCERFKRLRARGTQEAPARLTKPSENM